MVLQSMRSVAKYVWWFLVLAFVGSFLLYETSGLSGRAPVTTNTVVATVNGEDILLTTWQNVVANLEQQEQQRLSRGVTLDERRTLEDRAYDELVNDVLLRQEFKKRGISVTDEEIRQEALVNPPPQLRQSAQLLTDGKFDIEKYRRMIGSSQSKASGMLVGLESYFRSEIPKQKLFSQLAADVYVSDARLWQIYRDRHDTAQVSFALLRPETLTDTAVSVTDAEITQFYDRNRKRFERPARAVLSLVSVPRAVTAADSAAAKAKAERLRAEITAGAKFEDVAKRESNDSVSGADGGSMGKTTRGRLPAKVDEAVWALKIGELSQPVLTPFGWHVIRVDSRKADTAEARHILVVVTQSDSSATRSDRRADSLANKAANIQNPKAFDAAVKALGLTPATVGVIEKEPLNFAGRYVPSVSAWAFSGASVGESSDLFDSPEAYYVVRLDSLYAGGPQPVSEVREDIRRRLTREKRIEKLRTPGDELVRAARSGTLEAAAASKQITVESSQNFSRVDVVPGLGQFSQAIGASFTIPVGAVGGPVTTPDGMAVIRVNKRVEADRAVFELQKTQQRAQLMQSLQQQRVEEFLGSIRESAKIADHRAKVNAQLRKQAAAV